MKTNILTLAITLTIGVILAGSLLVPVINDAQNNTSDAITNNVTPSATFKIDGNDDYLFETNPNYALFKINGQTVDIRNWDDVGPVIVTDKCRLDKAGHIYGLFDATGARIINVNTTSQNIVCSYDASEKEFTYVLYTDLTNSEVYATYTYDVENIVYALPGGDYGAISTGGDPDVTYYVNSLSQVIAGGAYTTGDLDTSYFAEGSTVYVGNSSYTGSGTAVTAKYKDYIDVITGSSYAITITDGEDSETFTPYTVFVPLTVIAHTSEQNGMIALYGAIPVIVIVGLLVAAIGAIYTKRDD